MFKYGPFQSCQIRRWTEGGPAKRGLLSYMVRLKDGREVWHHVDHVCARAMQPEPMDNDASEDTDQRDMFHSFNCQSAG